MTSRRFFCVFVRNVVSFYLSNDWKNPVNNCLFAFLPCHFICQFLVHKPLSEIFAEQNLFILRVRVHSGMMNALEKGKHIGRPQTTKDDIHTIFYKHYPSFASGSMKNVAEPAAYADRIVPRCISI